MFVSSKTYRSSLFQGAPGNLPIRQSSRKKATRNSIETYKAEHKKQLQEREAAKNVIFLVVWPRRHYPAPPHRDKRNFF